MAGARDMCGRGEETRTGFWRENMKEDVNPRCSLEDNIKMYLKEIGWKVNWICLAQDIEQWHALLNMVMNLHVP